MASSPCSGFIADPAKCRSLSVNEKRELVRELSKCPGSALELLNEWTRRDIVQILCSDLRKERKYNGVSKQSILNYLFKAVNGKSSSPGKCVKEPSPEPNSSNVRFPYKRQRKNDVPPFAVIASIPVTAGVTAPTNNAHLCQNSACRASLNPADKFCRRCSCCICFKYDDNKDPSLWLFCNSDQPLQEESCGLSCHLECAFKDERSGIPQRGLLKKLDGDYYCIHCGKQNDLLGCWKKQLLIAKDARRLDVLCHRVFLSHKILISTEKYLALHEIVDTVMKKLEGEVGPITGIPDMGRGIVGRLAVGAEVQKLCTCAIERLESMSSGALTADLQIQRSYMVPSNFIKLEDISPGSVAVVFDLDVCPTLSQHLTGFNLWHRKASVEDYPSHPTGIIPMPSTMLVVRGLAPCTYYVIKVVAFTNSKEIGSWEVRTKTICCPKEEDVKNSMPVDAGTDPNNISPKANSSGPSNSSSEGAESYNDSTIYADLNRSPESDVEYCKNLDILYSEKASHHCNETDSNSQDLKMGDAGVTKDDEMEESPRVSASALDDDEEETGSAALAALVRKSSELMIYSRGTLKQNLAMIGSEIASHAHTGNKSVAPLEYSRSLPPIIQIGTENCKGVSGRSFEAKSGDHIPQGSSLKAETDPGSLSCKRSSGRIEDGGHEDGPSESNYNMTAQISSLRESSNLVLDKQGILLQNLTKDAARLENASGSPQYSGSLVPITGNVIKFGNGVSGTSSKTQNDDHVSQPGPSKPEAELGSSANRNSLGKSEDIDHKVARSGSSYKYCVKVIRWLECEGYIEANFRVKFLTWFSLQASPHERRIVSVFLDTLIDHPVSLTGQLSDTFSYAIYSKRLRQAPSGFCMKL